MSALTPTPFANPRIQALPLVDGNRASRQTVTVALATAEAATDHERYIQPSSLRVQDAFPSTSGRAWAAYA